MPDRRHTLSVLFREDSTLTPGRPYIASKQRRLAESDLDRYVADAAENGPLITPVPPRARSASAMVATAGRLSSARHVL
jgi:hypothetical protein